MAAMFSKNSGGNINSEAETIIGKSVKIEGNFNGEGNIIVEGEVQGSLKTNKNLEVKNDAKITADVEAANMNIAGEIHGNVKCSGTMDISSSGKIIGDIETKIIAVSAGAVIKGKILTNNGETKTSKNQKTND